MQCILVFMVYLSVTHCLFIPFNAHSKVSALTKRLYIPTRAVGEMKPLSPTSLNKRAGGGFSMFLVRSEESPAHPIARRTATLNQLFAKHSKRLGAPLKKRDFGASEWVNLSDLSSVTASQDNHTAIPLNDIGNDVTYVAKMFIGEEAVPFSVIADTGSSNLWFPASRRGSIDHQGGASLSTRLSSSTESSGQQWDITYGSGSVSGVTATDKVSFSEQDGLHIDKMAFGVATRLSKSLSHFSDGIMGLGFTQANTERVPTIIDELDSAGLLEKKLFGISLNRKSEGGGGKIDFGFVDPEVKDFVTEENVSRHGLWEIPVQQIVVNGQEIDLAGSTAIMDTGTTLALLPPSIANALFTNIDGVQSDGQGSFSVPCNTEAAIAFNFGGKLFEIPHQDWVGQQLDSTGTMCLARIVGETVGSDSQMLLGDTILKSLYAVFDLENNTISLASRSSETDKRTLPPSKPKSHNSKHKLQCFFRRC